MAIDTAAERVSVSRLLVPSFAAVLLPDGTLDQGDRQTSAWVYAGIAAAAPVVGRTGAPRAELPFERLRRRTSRMPRRLMSVYGRQWRRGRRT